MRGKGARGPRGVSKLPRRCIQWLLTLLTRRVPAAGQDRLLGGEDALAHGAGIDGLAQINQEVGLLRHQTQAGEGMQVHAVVRAADQEEQVGGLAIRRAKRNLLNRPAQREEHRLIQIRLRIASMQQGQSARDASRV